jgi:hypothetical protein
MDEHNNRNQDQSHVDFVKDVTRSAKEIGGMKNY